MLNRCSILDVRRTQTPMENRPAAAATSSTSRPHLADLPAAQRARRTNDPFANIETNTARGRRVGDLVRAYLRALGNPASIEHQAAIIAAAELQVLAEEARTTALRDSGRADLDQVIRLQGAADRAIRRLGLADQKRPAAGPTLAEYLAAKAPAEAAEDEPEGESTPIAPFPEKRTGGPFLERRATRQGRRK
jgi:hypothetical protein